MTKSLQQVNVTSTNPTTTNATEKAGASTIKNTDSHYYRGEDGLWHEKTTEKIIHCKDGEDVVDGKCVKKDPVCASDEELKDGACVKKSTCPTNYVESNNRCCPTDHPEYNASTGTCVNIRYDFVDQKTAIAANPDKKLSVGTNVIEGQAPSIGVDGLIQGATWDAANRTCQIHIEKGTFVDNAANESYTSEDAYTVTSDRYTESGCAKIASAKGAAIHIDGLTTTDDGKGNRILSDKDAKDAKIAIYKDAKDYINNGTEKYEKGILNLSDVKETYQPQMTYYERRPANFTVTYADGHTESWAGYSSDGTTLYDTNGNELTDSQKAQEVSLVCKSTGNAEVCNEGVKFDACSANEEPDRLGMICLFKKDGTEVQYSGNGFDRNSVDLIGSVSKHTAATEAMRNRTDWNDGDDSSEIRGYFRGVVSKVGDIVKDFYGTITGTKSSTEDKQVPVDVLAGTEDKDAEEKAAAQKQDAAQKQEAPTMDSQVEAVNSMNSATKNSDGSATVSKDGKIQKTAPATQTPPTEG